MDAQLAELTRQIAELTMLHQTSKVEQGELRHILEDIRNTLATQAGAMAVVSAEALSSRKAIETLKKKAISKTDESEFWKKKFEDLKQRESEIGEQSHQSSKKWIQANYPSVLSSTD